MPLCAAASSFICFTREPGRSRSAEPWFALPLTTPPSTAFTHGFPARCMTARTRSSRALDEEGKPESSGASPRSDISGSGL